MNSYEWLIIDEWLVWCFLNFPSCPRTQKGRNLSDHKEPISQQPTSTGSQNPRTSAPRCLSKTWLSQLVSSTPEDQPVKGKLFNLAPLRDSDEGVMNLSIIFNQHAVTSSSSILGDIWLYNAVGWAARATCYEMHSKQLGGPPIASWASRLHAAPCQQWGPRYMAPAEGDAFEAFTRHSGDIYELQAIDATVINEMSNFLRSSCRLCSQHTPPRQILIHAGVAS